MAISITRGKGRLHWAPLVLAAALLGPAGAQAANCEKNPNHETCTGSDGDPGAGNEKVSSRISFRDTATAPEDRIGSENLTGDVYVDSNLPDGHAGVDAFIGSEANTGNIFLRTWSLEDPTFVNRRIYLDFSQEVTNAPDCNPPSDLNYSLQFLKADVNDEVTDGIYALTEVGDSQDSEMRLRFIDGDGQAWFLNFGGGERKLCGSEGSSRVMVTREAVGGDPDIADTGDIWSVEPLEAAPGEYLGCLEKAGGAKGVKAEYCGKFNMPFRFEIAPD